VRGPAAPARRASSPRSAPATAASPGPPSSNRARCWSGRTRTSNGSAEAHGQRVSRPSASATTRSPPRSLFTTAQATQSGWASLTSSASTRSGRAAVAKTWLCGCSSEAPDSRPWLTITVTEPRSASRQASSRFRHPASTLATSPTGWSARVAKWSGPWITTSWAPPVGAARYRPPLGTCPGPANAGNLFGTTRTCHPGVSGAVAGSRSAQTSGGVMCSLPAQKGQPSGPRGAPCSRRNASGLAALPAVIATQRPLSGSWRSSPGRIGWAGGMASVPPARPSGGVVPRLTGSSLLVVGAHGDRPRGHRPAVGRAGSLPPSSRPSRAACGAVGRSFQTGCWHHGPQPPATPTAAPTQFNEPNRRQAFPAAPPCGAVG
jgi:hypothetical protein